jgi:hypothetical protein
LEPDRRYTFLLVPDHGSGRVRQVSLSLSTLRRWALVGAVVIGLLISATLGLFRTLPRAWQFSALESENLVLKGELREIEAQLEDLEAVLRRLRLYDAQLQETTEARLFPGWGPLDEEDAALLGQSGDTAEEEPYWEGEEGDPMEEIPEDPTALAADLRPVQAWASEVGARAELMHRLLVEVEPRLSLLAEEMEDMFSLQSAYPQVWPVAGQLTSGFGYRRSPISRVRKFHRGIDVSAPRGARVFAVAPGVVRLSQYVSGYGRMVILDHGYGIQTRYAHNTSLLVRAGDWVEVGGVIATVGSTGQSTGPHLHFEVLMDGQPVDPLNHLPR